MKKRVTSVLLAVLLLVVQVPSVFAVTASGTCGDNVTWTLDDSGTLTISGTGAMYDYHVTTAAITNENSKFDGNLAPWQDHYNIISKIIIQNGVTDIGNCAFYGCYVSNITIPDSVTTIGKWAFSSCDRLKSITIPNSIATIDDYAFQNCDGLTSLTISGNVNAIGNYAFQNCDGIIGLTISGNVNAIGQYAFQNCDGMTSLTISGNVNAIGKYAFQNCDKIASLTISGSVTAIDDYAFHNCDSLKDIYYHGNQEEWSRIRIGGYNEDLLAATVHYNAVPKTTPVKPESEPVEPEPQPVTPADDIVKYSYAFDNSAKSFGYPIEYKIPLSSFQVIFGQTALAKQKCEQAFKGTPFWAGSCYGMGTTIGLFVVSGNGVTLSAFRSGATRPGDLKVSDVHTEWGLTLIKFIEAMQISQYSSMTAMTLQRNRNHLSALTSAVSAFENGGGGPVLICVYGPDRYGAYCGHALLAYHLDGQRLYVYDCNTPNDGTRYITISENNWSYPIFDGVTWSNSNGSITYVPYESYLSDWTNRGHVQDMTLVSLVANVSAATVRDSAGKEVAVFQNGQMTRGSDNAYPFTPLGITPDGVSTAPPQVSVWLPVDDVYTVTNQDASKTSYEVSLCNVNQGVSVKTSAASVTLLAEDSTQSNSAMIESAGHDYTVTQMSGQNEITIQGTTGRDKFMSMIENGVSTQRSGFTASTSVTVNGKTVSASNFLSGNSVNIASISRQSPQIDFEDVRPGEYFYEPVRWAVGRGITNGTSPTTFSPQGTCSRNHILTFLWRANGSPAASVRNPFTDIDTSGDFGKAALWAYEKGLVSGTEFNGGAPCSRADVVTYLWKLDGRPSAGGNRFSDVPAGAEYAAAVSWAVSREITKGTSDTTFNPSGTCTRGHIVTFLYRAYAEK